MIDETKFNLIDEFCVKNHITTSDLQNYAGKLVEISIKRIINEKFEGTLSICNDGLDEDEQCIFHVWDPCEGVEDYPTVVITCIWISHDGEVMLDYFYYDEPDISSTKAFGYVTEEDKSDLLSWVKDYVEFIELKK